MIYSFHLSNNFKGNVNISIYDVLGRRVKTCLMNVTDSNRKEININLKPGVYIFKSVTKDKKIDVSKKFVVI